MYSAFGVSSTPLRAVFLLCRSGVCRGSEHSGLGGALWASGVSLECNLPCVTCAHLGKLLSYFGPWIPGP